MLAEKVDQRISQLKKTVDRLLSQIPISYNKATPSSFPETRGVYVITSSRDEVLRAGKTGIGNATLRSRLYHDHLMSSTKGNLPAQLVGSSQCADLNNAKRWIRENCSVRFLELNIDTQRAYLEHFILATLEPRFCDDNKFTKGSQDGSPGQ